MQKKLIALAIAGLASTAAFAQSNVTIYGIVDMGVVKVDADGRNDGWKIDNGLLSGSRIGFKGTEDLGSGLKALFTLEYMLMPDVNAPLGSAGDWSGSATRQAYTGLSGNWGTVMAGRLQGVGYNFACAHNPVAGGAFDTISKMTGAVSLLGCGSAGRYNNAVAYISPNFSGFTFEYNHARVTENATIASTVVVAPATTAAASKTNVDDAYANLARAAYANGPFAASLAYAKTEGGSTNGVNAVDIKEWGAGADYDFGMVRIYGTYQDRSTDKVLGVKNTADGDKWAVGASIPVMKVGSVMLSYGEYSSDTRGYDSDAWTIAYTHSLSKRTTLYGGYSAVSNDRFNVSGSAASRGVPRAGTATVGGGDADMWAFGMRHTF